MKGLNSWRKSHFLASDIIVALLLTGIAVSLLYLTPTGTTAYEYVEGNSTGLYKSTATIAGTLMGFSMTILVLAITFWQTEWYDLIKEDERASNQIWATLKQTTWFLALLTITCLACIAANAEDQPAKWTIVPYLTALSMAIVRLSRAIWVIQRMTGIAVAASRNSPPKQ